MAERNLLVVFPHNPFLQQNGVHARYLQLLRYFRARGLGVDMLSLENFVDEWPAEHRGGNDLVREVFLFDRTRGTETVGPPGKARPGRGLFRRRKRPRRPAFPNLAFREMQAQLDEIFRRRPYAQILIAYVHWAPLVESLPAECERILTVEDFITLNLFERHQGKIPLGECIDEEVRRVRLFQHAICISGEELAFFSRLCPATRMHHIPHFLPAPALDARDDKRHDVVYVGSDNPFNQEGATWFLEEVYPLLREARRVVVVGSVNRHLAAYRTRYPEIEFVPHVEDLGAIYRSSRVAICPIFGGTGLKIKVVEALAYGLPVVCTPQGMVGMPSGTTGCAVADSAPGFAARLTALLQDPGAHAEARAASLACFHANFSEAEAYRRLDRVFVPQVADR